MSDVNTSKPAATVRHRRRRPAYLTVDPEVARPARRITMRALRYQDRWLSTC